jgi:uncharacterized protein (UPF0248 family)
MGRSNGIFLKSMTLREVLNRIKWGSQSDNSVYQITYIHSAGRQTKILFLISRDSCILVLV